MLDPLFRHFMEVLDQWNPNPERDPQNYAGCLGLFLARAGLDFEQQSQEVFENLALWPTGYIKDLIQQNHAADIEGLIEDLGHQRAAEYFYHLHRIFESCVWPDSKKRSRAPLSKEERAQRLRFWLKASKNERQDTMQQLYNLAMASDTVPWEWILELLDLKSLRAVKVV